jgi:site-specific recombinase XerD
MKSLERFRGWLAERGYGDSSINKAVTDIVTYERFGEPPEAQKRITRLRDYRWAWRLYQEFAEETGASPSSRPEPVVPSVKGPRKRRLEPEKILESTSIDAREWEVLRDAIRDTPGLPARVLEVQSVTGKRVSDVLRLSHADLKRGFDREDGLTQATVKGRKAVTICVKGGGRAELAWSKLFAVLGTYGGDGSGAKHVADALSPGSQPNARSGAYKRVERKLHAIARELETSGRIHTHRLRRSLVVRLMEAGVDLGMIQKAVDHDDIRTTQRYSNEPMATQVAGALRKLD